MPSASSADLRCCTSKSGGTYSANITGVMASTLTRRTNPPDLRAISIAALIAGLARSVSARSTGTRIFLYMTAPLFSLRALQYDTFSEARLVEICLIWLQSQATLGSRIVQAGHIGNAAWTSHQRRNR